MGLAVMVALALMWPCRMTAADDRTSVLQTDVHHHHTGHKANASSPCTCLGWQDAYTKFGAKCGEGHELDIVPVPGPDAARVPTFAFEFCAMYFGSLPNDNLCMNAKWEEQPQEWCYVGKDCQSAFASQGNGPLKTKFCNRGEDASLGQMGFEEFAHWVYERQLELGLAAQYAYPTWHGEKLPEVQAFWGLKAPGNTAPISEQLKARLQAHVDSGKTMFISSVNGHPPFAVSEGHKLYYINYDPMGKVDFGKKQDICRWACVAGCGKNNKSTW